MLPASLTMVLLSHPPRSYHLTCPTGELQLRDASLPIEAGALLGEVLRHNQTLTHLSLWKNDLNASGGKALLSGIKGNTALEHMDLRANALDEACGLAIAAHLQRNTRIRALLLSDNNLGPACGLSLASSWIENDTLTTLDVRANKFDLEATKALRGAKSAVVARRQGKGLASSVELLMDDAA